MSTVAEPRPAGRTLAARFLLAVGVATIAAIALLPSQAAADHSWGGYHWARTSNPFSVNLTDHMGATWDASLIGVASDWSASTMLDTPITPSFETKNCKAKPGRIEVCNGKYGFSGWLGVSQIWISGGHIRASTVKVNDAYFNLSTYNRADARQSVLCMEVGHSLGLDHQDGVGDSCMDDASYDWPNIIHPNAHDFDQLVAIYNHLDSSSTLASATDTKGNKGTTQRLSPSLYVENRGGDKRLFTWVYWKDRAAAAAASDQVAPG
jgi:hypothetical protein